MPFDSDLFVKIMSRTLSDNDHEALLSLRKATKMLIEANLTWEKIIKLAMIGKARPRMAVAPQFPDFNLRDINPRDVLVEVARAFGEGLGETIVPAAPKKGRKK